MSKRKKKSRSRRRRVGSAVRRARRRVRRAVVRIERKVVSMARKARRRSGRRRRGGFRRGGGGGGGPRGFINRELLAAVGGTVGSFILTPMIAKFIPASIKKNRMLLALATAALGVGGYALLRKYNKTAALAWAGASIAPVVLSFVGGGNAKKKAMAGLGDIGVPDGVDYSVGEWSEDVAGYLGEGDDDISGFLGDYSELEGLGEFDESALELV